MTAGIRKMAPANRPTPSASASSQPKNTSGPCAIEPSVGNDPTGTRYQFERTAYFIGDTGDSAPGALVFNRTVTLRDTWAKIKGK